MTPNGVSAVFAAAKKIGIDNVWYFFQDFLEYQTKFINEETGILYTRDEIKRLYGRTPSLLNKYDEIIACADWLDISDLYTSAQANYNCRRYDFNTAQVKDDNLIILDRDNGDLHYIACDQVNAILRYDSKQIGKVINKTTGVVEDVEINKEKTRVNFMYKG